MKSDALVVGGGVMGTAAAYWLARLGRHVTLLEQGDLPNPCGSSGDHLRVFRLTYGRDAFYTDLASRAQPLWLDLNQEAGEPLLVQNGMLEFAVKEGGYEAHSQKVLEEHRIKVERIEKLQMRRQYPMVNSRAVKFALYHPGGGMIWAMRTTSALSHLAQRRGAKVRTHTKVTEILRGPGGVRGVRDAAGKEWTADRYVFTAGPWTAGLLKRYKLPLKVTRQQQLYLRPPANRGRYRPEHFPVFASLSTGFYGFPMHIHGFMKIGHHDKGPVGFPKEFPETDTTPQFERKVRGFFKKFIPDLAGFSEMEGKVCYYTNTQDDDFILDRLPDAPNAVLGAGFSGHGFKFAPLIGKTLAELALGGKPEINLHRFRAHRF